MEVRMKKLSLIYMVLSSAYILPNMPQLAQTMNFYELIKSLRNKTAEHLDKIEDQMRNRISILESHDLASRSEGLYDRYRELYADYSEKIDNAFDYIDRIFTTEGVVLDNRNAPLAEKKEFILALKKEAERIINKIIKESILDLEKEYYY